MKEILEKAYTHAVDGLDGMDGVDADDGISRVSNGCSVNVGGFVFSSIFIYALRSGM